MKSEGSFSKTAIPLTSFLSDKEIMYLPPSVQRKGEASEASLRSAIQVEENDAKGVLAGPWAEADIGSHWMANATLQESVPLWTRIADFLKKNADTIAALKPGAENKLRF